MRDQTHRFRVLRYRFGGRQRDMGFGRFPEVSLAEARELARRAREQLRQGSDPLDAREAHRTRIETVLDFAIAQDWRGEPNPARWRGHLAKLLPPPSRLAPVEHHAALAHADLPIFMETLRVRASAAARALEFTILTAARTSEVLGARWNEMDRVRSIWTVPAVRTKAARAHRVPLSKPALAILNAMRRGPSAHPRCRP